MKLSLAQALATVLDINLTPDGKSFIHNGVIICEFEKGLDIAVCRAIGYANLNTQSNFAIFPITSDREDIYMSTERELLRQEMTLEGPMWTKMGEDPRELVTTLMGQLRECAVNVVAPTQYQMHMQRVSCLAVASLQWIGNWISKMRVQQAVLKTRPIEVPKVVEIGEHKLQQEMEQQLEEPKPLFGAGGVGALKVLEPEMDSTDKIMEANNICSKHDEARPCRECIAEGLLEKESPTFKRKGIPDPALEQEDKAYDDKLGE